MPDSTLIQPVSSVIAVFGVPLTWLAAAIPMVIVIINSIKSLVPYWVQSVWYPWLGLLISIGYAYATLRPDWVAVGAGGVGLWLTQWGAWVAAKRTAAALGARPQ